MEEESWITHEEYLASAELFRSAFPAFAAEVARVEAMRGKLNEFQLSRAVTMAADSVEILGWNSRRTVLAIFDVYVELYRGEGREAADRWVEATFGAGLLLASGGRQEQADPGLLARLAAVEEEIRGREAELLELYRELTRLKAEASGTQPPDGLRGRGEDDGELAAAGSKP
ncbi:hypothetical protein HGI30_16380 [Paenibacillus albicereus]|uniref:Uncharacterized protein n=1 Tax=Paenibacillus albicereus TaxID=2726185 RepID=A0A6H2GZZ7_9BACL|nr:hypothetical protein [Paenibacillus albicereus]QJC52990.1 hypothetical protein HGI30_16380 [Paenibacillus albicereus]